MLYFKLFSIFGNAVKHGLSCLMYYIIATTIVVCYSFKDVRAHLWHIFNLTSRICMGYPFYLWDALWSALKSLKTHYICNCLAQKHGLVFQNERCTAHGLICGCQADMQQVQHNQECDYSECMCVTGLDIAATLLTVHVQVNNIIYLIIYLYLSSDGLFTCSTLTPECWRLKIVAPQLNGIKVNPSPHKYA